MSGFIYLTRAVHMPVTAHGSEIRNNFGVKIATAIDPYTASCLADIINMGQPAAQAHDDAHDAREAATRQMFSRHLAAKKAQREA